MGTPPQRNPGSTVKCLICGRLNPVGRLYCQFCRQRLPDPLAVGPIVPVIPILPVDPIVDPLEVNPVAEVESLQAALKAAQNENLTLQQLLGPMQEELARLKAATPNPEHSPEHVAVLASSLEVAKGEAAKQFSHAEGWKDKWKSAEEKAAALEEKLVAKTKEVEEFIKKHGGTNPVPYLKSIVGFITLLGSLAGYGTGRYVQPKNDATGKISQLVAQVANAQQQIGDLKSALKAADDKAEQVQSKSKTDLNSANQQTSDLTARQKQLQHQLNEAVAQKASTADQIRNQSRADLDAANRKISELTARDQQLQRQLSETVAQKASTNEMVNQRNAEIASLHAQLAPRGSVIWSGNLTGKRTIQIKNGAPNFGALSGALPQKSCRVSTQDGRVKIKSRPSKNHWNDLSFEVSGSGLVQVRIDWEISQ